MVRDETNLSSPSKSRYGSACSRLSDLFVEGGEPLHDNSRSVGRIVVPNIASERSEASRPKRLTKGAWDSRGTLYSLERAR